MDSDVRLRFKHHDENRHLRLAAHDRASQHGDTWSVIKARNSHLYLNRKEIRIL
jgi:hypothetical protein